MSSIKPSPISPTSKLLEAQTPLFLDYNQGNKQLPALLRMAGFKVECHITHFKKDEDDDVWIKECARRGWVIVTSDKNIEHDPTNRQAVIESQARVFFLEEKNARAILWASAIIVSKAKLWDIVLYNEGPFFADVKRETRVLITEPRTPA